MSVTTPYTPHPAKAFFGVFLCGAFLLGFMHMGRQGVSDPEVARIISACNTAGVFLTSIIAAATTGWRLPIFAKVVLFHLAAAIAVGFLGMGTRGLAYAIGGSTAFALMYGLPSWLILSRDWFIGRILFWGLVALFGLGIAMLILG